MGDFNETLYATEHFSTSARPEWQMRAFREVVDECSFQDLGWSGVPYTWDNRQGGNTNVKARLDRAFANEDFRQLYDHIGVRHVCAAESDHCFIVVNLNQLPNRSRSKRQFRYENVWQPHIDYQHLVTETWRRSQRGPGLWGVADSLGEL